MRKILFIFTLLILLSGCSWFSPRGETMPLVMLNSNHPAAEISSYIDITASEALKLIKANRNLIIIDVSPDYDQGHLPGSINLYVGDGSLDQAIPTLSPTATYLVYCHVDSAAILGSQKLVEAGFSQVYRLTGNYGNWVSLGYPVEIALHSVNNYSGQGLALRSNYYKKFELSVSAELPEPMLGKFYEGWLVKTEPSLEFFSTGKLTKSEVPNQEFDYMYNLFYSNQDNKSDFNQVVITSETEANGLDGVPETHILEGMF